MSMILCISTFLGGSTSLDPYLRGLNCGWHAAAHKLVHLMHAQCSHRGNCNGRLQPLHLQPQNFYEYQRNACVHSQSCLLRSSKPFNFPTPAMSFPWEFSGTSAARNQLGFGPLGHAPRQSNPATSCVFGWCDWWLSDTELDTNILLILK